MEIFSNQTPLGNVLKLCFCPNPRIEVAGQKAALYRVRLSDDSSGWTVYDTRNDKGLSEGAIPTGGWCEASPRYYVPWRIQVEENGQSILDYKLDLSGRRVLVNINTPALGDTIAWFSAIERFRLKHGCKVTVRSRWNMLFEENYPQLAFENLEQAIPSQYFISYEIGCTDNNYDWNKQNWRSVPLQMVASDYLGLAHEQERASIVRSKYPSQVTGKYVAISEGANGYLAKRWIAPGGWQRVVDHLVGLGYKVVSISAEATELKNVLKRNGRSIEKTIRTIQHADLFIGCDSGPSWLAWAIGVPTVVVSGFTKRWGGAPTPYRAINEACGCVGCINDKDLPLDRGCFQYCPRGKQHVCSTSITPDMVIEQITRALADPLAAVGPFNLKVAKRVLILAPHTSTGGCPAYVVQQVQKLKASGTDVAVVEWADLGNAYVVQRRRLQAQLGDRFYQVNQNADALFKVIGDFEPDDIVLQEAPELFLPDGVAQRLWATRNYRLVVTSHNSDYRPEQVKWWPDTYAWVSNFHQELFADACKARDIPITVAEYQLPKRERPDRTEALTALGLDPAALHVLNVGLFTPGKNQSEIWRIARCLPHVQFHCVGNQAPNFEGYWGPMMADKPTNVRVWGERDDVNKFYSGMDLFLFTSTRECSPLVVKEALSWQMPVLMRALPAYCGVYDTEPLVTYTNGDLAETVALARERLKIYETKIAEETVTADSDDACAVRLRSRRDHKHRADQLGPEPVLTDH